MKNKINLQMQNISFVLIIALAVWLKTYLITRFSFDLKIESSTQELILFISPLAASLAFVGLALFATGEKKKLYRAMYQLRINNRTRWKCNVL